MSDMSKTLRQNLAEVMGIVGYVQKDGKNQAQSYPYASAEAVLKKVNAALSTRGICIESEAELLHFNVTQFTNDRGHTRFRSDAAVRITLTFTADHFAYQSKEDKAPEFYNEAITVQGLGQSTDTGDKAIMKANTAAIKYCLTNAFLISWGDDPEAAAAGDPPKKTKATPKAAPKKKVVEKF
jgi:hypothetical protein